MPDLLEPDAPDVSGDPLDAPDYDELRGLEEELEAARAEGDITRIEEAEYEINRWKESIYGQGSPSGPVSSVTPSRRLGPRDRDPSLPRLNYRYRAREEAPAPERRGDGPITLKELKAHKHLLHVRKEPEMAAAKGSHDARRIIGKDLGRLAA